MTAPISGDIPHIAAQRSVSRPPAAGAKRAGDPDDLRSPEAAAQGDLQEHSAPQAPDFGESTHPRPHEIADDDRPDAVDSERSELQAQAAGSDPISPSRPRSPYDPEPSVPHYLDIIA